MNAMLQNSKACYCSYFILHINLGLMKLREDLKPQKDVTQKLCQARILGGEGKTLMYQEIQEDRSVRETCK